MGAAKKHLVQANIGLGRGHIDDPVMGEFVALLDRINAVADEAPGFVWRLQTDDGDATSIKLFDEPRMIVNMSVWESIETLFDYVYRSEHLDVLRRRKEWFEKLPGPHAVSWWIPAGEIPGADEIPRRLELLERNGSGPEAFSLRELYDAGGMRVPPPRPADRPRRAAN